MLVKCLNSAVVSRETYMTWKILDSKPPGVSRETNLSNLIRFNRKKQRFYDKKFSLSRDFEN